MAIDRHSSAVVVAIASGSPTSSGQNFRPWAGGVCHVPSTWGSNTTLTFQHATESDGTYTDLYQDDCTTQVSVTMTAARSFAIPDEVMMCNWVKFKIGANAAQAETLELSLKG